MMLKHFFFFLLIKRFKHIPICIMINNENVLFIFIFVSILGTSLHNVTEKPDKI